MNWKFWKKNKEVEKMSFQETFDLVGLPIITFKQGNKKFNFLLDTGANRSIINSSLLKQFIHKESTRQNSTCYGVEGNSIAVTFVQADVEYKGNVFTDDFQVIDMTQAFTRLKKEYGVNIHGVLGSAFMSKYKYVLDFEKLIAYSKKV